MDEIDNWSRAINIFLQKAPDTQVQVALVSNVLAERYFRNSLTRLRKRLRDRQRIGEFLQVMSQLVSRKQFEHVPFVTFGEPFTLECINARNNIERLLPHVKNLAREMMLLHIKRRKKDQAEQYTT